MKLVPLIDHPSNNDRAARLEWSAPDCRASVYSVRSGFVACKWVGAGGYAIEGHFPTKEAAREAVAA